jgi:pimeloyl-ACP methyl ester carboxylesterase
VDQLPFHFADPEGSAMKEFAEGVSRMHLSPDVLRTMANSDYGGIEVEDALPRIEKPVLVISAEWDRVASPEAGWEIAEKVPNGECVLLKNAGHMMFVERPGIVMASIRQFFQRFPVAANPPMA